MKVALYARVSTDKQEALNQIIQLRAYAEKSGWDVWNEYVDVVTGKENKRPAWDLMFQHAHQKLYDVLLFWRLDRFSRSGTLYTLQKLKELENLGIEWVSYQEQHITTMGPYSDIIISVLATVAKMEREKISERTKAGLVHAKNVGKRGKDKKARKARSDRGIPRKTVIEKVRNRKPSVYSRKCNRCGVRYATRYRTGKICPKCRGGN